MLRPLVLGLAAMGLLELRAKPPACLPTESARPSCGAFHRKDMRDQAVHAEPVLDVSPGGPRRDDHAAFSLPPAPPHGACFAAPEPPANPADRLHPPRAVPEPRPPVQ